MSSCLDKKQDFTTFEITMGEREMGPEGIAIDLRRHFFHTLGRDKYSRVPHYSYQALALTVRDRLMDRWKNTTYAYIEQRSRRAHYLSLEYLMGRALGNAILNLGISDATSKALGDVGLIMEELENCERDAGLGNGGLGRLAACFLDSCATLQLPVIGYGLRYEYGLFRQKFDDGHQVEEPDHWLRNRHIWELERPEYAQRIQFGGYTESWTDEEGKLHVRWENTHDVLAVPYDVPVPGYQNGTVNTLRLWKSVATDAFDLGEFNAGSYTESVRAKNEAEHITMVLYPNDASENGKELRLKQQYLLVSASLQDILRCWVRFYGRDFSQFAEKNCFQLNDTHPAIAVPELMRLLMDIEGMEWEEAWEITSKTMAYTNHTLLPEALEKWSVSLFRRLLPRLLDIIYEINARFLKQVEKRWPGDEGRLARMSIIEENHEPMVRMAYLAIVGSYSVNGVAALHSKLLAEGLLRDFHELWPEKFNNKTNGVTQRRWLAACNPGLNRLITKNIGNGWVTELSELRKLLPLADDPAFQEQWRKVKHDNKLRLATLVQDECHVNFDLDMLFDIQVKRIHEYKRQQLNILHVIHLYDRIKRGDIQDWTPRAVLFGGKAAPGYAMAKRIIKLINNVARVINNDPATEGLLRVAFLPDYRVSAMEIICPGTELSEQISTAGKEASGTGNMKFMMNGALTIGTLDGANIEIREEAGEENFFLFGLTAAEVEKIRQNYDPTSIIAADKDFTRVMEMLEANVFSKHEPGIFDPIVHTIRSPHDPWLVAADFREYVLAQRAVAEAYRDPVRWTRMSIINTATSGKFSADRTIREYANDIWKIKSIAAKPVQ